MVLVADTDPDARGSIEGILRDFAVDVGFADDADSAMKIFIERGPALVFIDVFLPRRGGVDFLRRLRSTAGGKAVSCIMLCGVKGLSDLRNEAMGELEARAFLSKPLYEASLRNHITRVLQQPTDKCCGEEPLSLFAGDFPPTRGELDKYPFALLFRQLADTGYTGMVHLAREKEQKAVYFIEGQVVFASSNRVAETLGRQMLEKGVISQELYSDALAKMQSSGQRFGAILVEMGAMDAEGIEQAVKDNIIEKVANAFGWTSGRYALASMTPPVVAFKPGEIDCRTIIWRGIVEHLHIGEIFGIMKNSINSYVVAKRDPLTLEEEFEIGEGERIHLEGARNLLGKTLQQSLSIFNSESTMRLLMALFALEYFAVCSNPECEYITQSVEGETMRNLLSVRRLLQLMKNQNHFQVLGIPLDADDAMVRHAYQEKVKVYHPDALSANAQFELKQLYSEIFLILQNAFEKVEKAEPRRAYLRSLQTGIESTFMEGTRLLDAETSFQQGMSLARKRKWNEALPLLEDALKLNPDEPEYALQCGIAKMNQQDGDRGKLLEEAKKHFLKAAELDFRSGEPFYRLGYLYKMNGETKKAIEYFQRTLIRNPSHAQARLEIRLLDSRKNRGVRPVMASKNGSSR